MPEHISSSMYASKITKLDAGKLKDFIRCLVISQRKAKEKDMARDELKKQIAKVQKLAAQKIPSQISLKKSVAEIEDKVNTLPFLLIFFVHHKCKPKLFH